MSRLVDEVKQRAARRLVSLVEQKIDIKGLSMIIAQVVDVDMNALRDLGRWNERYGEVLTGACPNWMGKVNLVAMVTPEAMKRGGHAGNLIKGIAGKVGGGGGGKPNIAQAGGKNPQGIKEALEEALEIAKSQIAD